jgi:zearalenone synthase (highly reducing iterative type I polyketide synthase)
MILMSREQKIGHLEAAAGIAGIIKAVLILENGSIPPTIHLKKLNPKIPFDKWNLEVPTKVTPWPTDGVRRISTNSFGYGGTNAHAVLEDAYHYLKRREIRGTHFTKTGLANGHTMNGLEKPGINGFHHHDGPRLVVLTAQDKQGLSRVRDQLVDYIDTKLANLEDDSHEKDTLFRRLAYSLNEKHSRLQWKTFAIASSLDDLAEKLKDKETPMTITQSSRVPRIGFVFTGQGAQWPRMGIELMGYKTFEKSFKAADRYLREECNCSWSAIDELEKGKLTSQLHLAAYSQTLCTILQVALVDLLKTWNISPVAVAGHSSGEIAAAYCRGALSREDAWKVAYYRGILSSDMKITDPDLDGSMMAVGASPEEAQKWISQATKGDVVVACINSPSSVTLSGDTSAIDEVLEMIQKDGVFARKLHVDTAYHSPHMQVVAQEYYEALFDIVPLNGRDGCTMHSSVTGSVIEPRDLGAVNWVKNLTSTVRFSDAIYDMMRPRKGKGQRSEENMVDILIEIGPHSALQGPATQSLKAHGISNIPYLSVLKRNTDGVNSAIELAGSLSTMGVQVDINTINNNGELISPALSPKILIDLPSYPWKHSQRHWHESRAEIEYRKREQPQLSLLGAPTPPNGENEKVWRGSIDMAEEPWIADHKIQGLVLYPAAGFLAMAVEAATQMSAMTQKHMSAYRLRDVQLTSAAVVTEGDSLECVIQLRPHVVSTKDLSSTWTEFVIASSTDGKSLVRNCSGLLLLEFDEDEGPDMRREEDYADQAFQRRLLEASLRCKTPISTIDFYADLTKMGLEYGPAFANLTAIRNAENESVYAVKIPDIETRITSGKDRPHIIHPATLDAIFHAAFAAVKGSKTITLSTAMVPRSIEEIVISSHVPYESGVTLNGFSNAARHGFNDLTSDIFVFNEQETRPVVQIKGFLCTKIPSASSFNATETRAKSIVSSLVWKPAIDLLLPEEQKIAIENGSKFILDDSAKRNIKEQDSSALTAIRRLVGEISKVDVSPELIPFYEVLQAESNKTGLYDGSPNGWQVDTIHQMLQRVFLAQGETQKITRDEHLLNSLLWEGQRMKCAMAKLAEVSLLNHELSAIHDTNMLLVYETTSSYKSWIVGPGDRHRVRQVKPYYSWAWTGWDRNSPQDRTLYSLMYE